MLPRELSNELIQTDLSIFRMYMDADIVVKAVMLALLFVSVITWAIFFGKFAIFSSRKRRLKREQQKLLRAHSLHQVEEILASLSPQSLSLCLLREVQQEQTASKGSPNIEGIKTRVAFRLQQRTLGFVREARRGNSFIATVGAVAPFVGLFGTVWGIMDSFIRIAKTQTTSLAVVAPGIAEALLATAMGLIAAIPAVVMYNFFARRLADYKASLECVVAQLLLLHSRDLDLRNSKQNDLGCSSQQETVQ